MMILRSSSYHHQKWCTICTRARKPCNLVSCKSGLLNSLILVSFLLSSTGDELDKMRAQLNVNSELLRSHLNMTIGTLETALLEDLYVKSGVSEVSGVADPIASDMS